MAVPPPPPPGYESSGAVPPPPGPPGSTNVGLSANLAAALCYVPICCLNIVWAIYVVLVEKQSRFLRFHAFQSLLFSGVMFAAGILVQLVGVVSATLSFVLAMLLLVAGLGAAIFLAVKAYNNEEFELPQLGALARQWV